MRGWSTRENKDASWKPTENLARAGPKENPSLRRCTMLSKQNSTEEVANFIRSTNTLSGKSDGDKELRYNISQQIWFVSNKYMTHDGDILNTLLKTKTTSFTDNYEFSSCRVNCYFFLRVNLCGIVESFLQYFFVCLRSVINTMLSAYLMLFKIMSANNKFW